MTIEVERIVDRLRDRRYPLADIRLAGAHNLLNVRGRRRVRHRRRARRTKASPRALAKFEGLAHRTALVAEVAGVRYYDDSKGTNVGAAVAALRGLAERAVVLIAGGRDKRGAYAPLVEALAQKGRAVVLIGEAAERIAAEPRGTRARRRARRRWPRPWRSRHRSPSPATPCSSARRARASTCSATTRSAATSSLREVRALAARAQAPPAPREAPHERLLSSPANRRARKAADGPDRPGARGGRHRAHRLRRGDGLQRERDRSRRCSFHDPQYFLKRQAIYAVVALGLMWVTSHIDYHRSRRLTYPILGARHRADAPLRARLRPRRRRARWLALGPIHVQPAEMAKLALVLWLAYSLAKKADKIKTFLIGFLPHLLMAGFLMLLCLKQPDFGSAVVLLFLTFTMLFVAGARIGYMLGAIDRRRGGRHRPRSSPVRTAWRATSPGSTWTSTARTSPTSRSSR